MFIRDFPLQVHPLWHQQYLTLGNKSEYWGLECQTFIWINLCKYRFIYVHEKMYFPMYDERPPN